MKRVKYMLASFAFLCITSISAAQSEEQTVSELSVEVFDIVTLEPLRDYGFWFINEQDTLKMHIDSVDNMKIGLDERNHYAVTVFKEGYDTLSADFDIRVDSAKVDIHFYVPKMKMSKEEKRTANYNSRNLPPSIFDKSTCFDSFDPKRKYLWVMKAMLENSEYIESWMDCKKVRNY